MYMSTATTQVTQKSAGHRASRLASMVVGASPVRVGRRFANDTANISGVFLCLKAPTTNRTEGSIGAD